MKRLIAIVATLLCLAAPATVLAAYNPLGGACGAGGGASSSSGCNVSANDPLNGSNGIIHKTANIISILGGVTAVILIIIGGFQYVTSGGDPQKVTGARNMILGSVIGLVIIALAQAVIIFVLTKT